VGLLLLYFVAVGSALVIYSPVVKRVALWASDVVKLGFGPAVATVFVARATLTAGLRAIKLGEVVPSIYARAPPPTFRCFPTHGVPSSSECR